MRVAPLLRASELRALRGLIRAAPAEWPYRHGALEQRVGELEDLHPELGFPYPPEPTPIPELAAAGSPTIDRAADRQGQAPEGTREAAAVVEMVPANACPAAQPLEAIDMGGCAPPVLASPIRATVQQDSAPPMRATVQQDRPVAQPETITCARCQLRAPPGKAARMAADCIERPCSLRAIAA